MPYQYEETAVIRAAADVAYQRGDSTCSDAVLVPRGAFTALVEAVKELENSYDGKTWIDTNGPDLSWREFWELVGPGKES